MARIELTVYDITRTGKSLNDFDVAITAATGAQYRNSGREWVRLLNLSGVSATLTVPIPRTVDGAAVASKTWTIVNNDYFYLPPFPTDSYNYPNEKVYLDTTQNLLMVVFRDGS